MNEVTKEPNVDRASGSIPASRPPVCFISSFFFFKGYCLREIILSLFLCLFILETHRFLMGILPAKALTMHSATAFTSDLSARSMSLFRRDLFFDFANRFKKSLLFKTAFSILFQNETTLKIVEDIRPESSFR